MSQAKIEGKTILRGSMLLGAATIAARFVGIAVQIVLGWILTKEQYGTYGVALSLTAIFACFHENGVYKVLVQRGDEFEKYRNAGFWLSYLLSGISALGFMIVGLVYVWRTGDSMVFWMVIVLAGAQLMGASSAVYRAKLATDLRFGPISKTMFQSRSLHQLLMIPFSLLGCGVLSFVLPSIFSRAFDVYSFRRAASIGKFKVSDKFPGKAIREVVSPLRWIILTAFGIAMIQQGDYLVLTWMAFNRQSFGVYVFGFQLTSTFARLITANLFGVFLPAISKIKDDEKRLATAYLKTLKALCALSFPFCFACFLLVGPAIQIAWNSKWNEAIIVSQVLLLVLPIRFLAPVGRSFMEAKGKWSMVTLLMYLDVFGVVTATIIGASIGTLTSIVVSVSIWRFFIGAIQLFVIPLLIQVSFVQTSTILGKYLTVTVSSLAVGCGISLPQPFQNVNLIPALLSLAGFTVTYTILGFLFCRSDYMAVWKAFR